MSRFRVVEGAIAGLLALTGASCDRLADENERVVVSLGEYEASQADLNRFIQSRTGLGGTLDAPLLSALLEEFVREQLLVIAAEEEGVEVSEIQLLNEIGALRRGPGIDVVRAESPAGSDGAADGPESPDGGDEDPEGDDGLRSRVRQRLLVDRLMNTVVLDGLEATEEAMQLEFEANRPFYARPETVTLAERRFDDRQTAEAAARVLREGAGSEDQEEAAEPFAPIGTFRRGELPDAVDQAVFRLEPGDFTEAVETAAGFRVFRVDERLPAAALEFEDVVDVVRLTVLRREADARVQALVEELQRRHPVRIHTDNLSFPYIGTLERAE